MKKSPENKSKKMNITETKTKVRVLEERENGVCLFEISSGEVRVLCSNLGCHILSMYTRDRYGRFGDIVLGYENVEECALDGSYMGAVVGRVANRIKNASFMLNGKKYKLAANDGRNSLHGGFKGFDRKLFGYEQIPDGIRFVYESTHMEEGYPGNLAVEVDYRLCGRELQIDFRAKSDEDTLCNLTNHSYFNLLGGQEKIYGHQLKIRADRFAGIDENGCTDGTFFDVEGTPFDFRQLTPIGEQIGEEKETAVHPQLKRAGGYDHSFLVNGGNAALTLYEPVSGRTLVVTTTMPCIHIYTANFLAGGVNGKHGKPYENRNGIAIETQFLPDSIHIEENPSVILRKGEQYEETTVFRFGVEKVTGTKTAEEETVGEMIEKGVENHGQYMD